MFVPREHAEATFAFRQDAEARYPQEACGFITAEGYIACPNISKSPTTDFEISPALFVATNLRTPVLAVVHSHPDGEPWPTANDMAHQIAMGIPWGLCSVVNGSAGEVVYWGDGVPVAPLLGRPFISGVWDCFTLVQDYYREKGIIIPSVPHDFDWYAKGENFYEEMWEPSGFVEVSRHELQEGDAYLMQVRSKVPNHAGIYLGDGTVLHHFRGRLSCREAANNFAPKVSRWLRHKSMMEG